MRLIDANHLKSMLQEYIKREQAYIDIGNNKTIAIGHSNGLWEAIAQIDEEPTIEPQRIKGHWQEITEGDYSGYDPVLAGYDDPVVGYVCSICHEEYEKDKMGEPTWNYCPNCGTNMRGQ